MIIVLGLTFVVVVCIIVAAIDHFGDGLDCGEGFAITGFIIGIILAIVLIALPIQRGTIKANIMGFNSVRETFAMARENKAISPLELAAIQAKVADSNEWLANQQYWARSPLTDWFYPKSILDIKPIR